MSLTPTGIAYDRAGPRGGTPLVLLHAGVADRRMWDPVWASLTAARDCVRLDLRGFGESDRAPTTGLDPARDVRDTLDHLGVARAHLVGASFGSGVAVELALTDPGRVASLLLAPPGGSLLAELTPDLQAFLDAERSALAADDLDAAVRANVDTWLVGPGRNRDEVPPALVEAVGAMQRRAFEVDATWDEVEEVELDPPALDRLGELAGPVHVLVGDLDLLTTADAARRLCAAVPQARRTDWAGVAHLPSLERPTDFADLVFAWVSDPARDG